MIKIFLFLLFIHSMDASSECYEHSLTKCQNDCSCAVCINNNNENSEYSELCVFEEDIKNKLIKCNISHHNKSFKCKHDVWYDILTVSLCFLLISLFSFSFYFFIKFCIIDEKSRKFVNNDNLHEIFIDNED